MSPPITRQTPSNQIIDINDNGHPPVVVQQRQIRYIGRVWNLWNPLWNPSCNSYTTQKIIQISLWSSFAVSCAAFLASMCLVIYCESTSCTDTLTQTQAGVGIAGMAGATVSVLGLACIYSR